MSDNRKISGLIPYKRRDGEIFVFLQKRAKDARMLPDSFVFFGGGIEKGENPEETMLREIREELDFVPEGYKFLDSYKFENHLEFHIFMLEVNDDFERNIKILEGEYGKYFSEKEALGELKFTDEGKIMLRDLCKFLRA
ncbi:MAG: NUDIX hydrolase [Candidatus Pacebacteria bacterium]|nr:NUDIX hydrolase [Candidatus Paceibacterota bacterium]